jgi:hypothetical protein
MKWKCISSLKTRIYPQIFPNASTVTWSLVLQTINLANKIEDFSKCDDFSGEISQLTDQQTPRGRILIGHVGLNEEIVVSRWWHTHMFA